MEFIPQFRKNFSLSARDAAIDKGAAIGARVLKSAHGRQTAHRKIIGAIAVVGTGAGRAEI